MNGVARKSPRSISSAEPTGCAAVDHASEKLEGGDMRVRTVLAGAAFLLFAVSAHAQISTGNIIGVVHDESNAVLPGATATLTSAVLPGGPATTVTNAQG